MQINCVGVINILESLRHYTPTCRFLNMGSSEQFGDVAYSPQDIKHPMRSRSVYGASKVGSGQVIKVYRESYGLYALQPICFNHESERRGEEFITRKVTKGVTRIKQALDKGESFEPIELGNLDAKRDWSHALDFMDGVWRMLNQEKYTNIPWDLYMNESEQIKYYSTVIQEYILASGETHSIKEFCEEAFHAAGIKNVYWFKGHGEVHESLWLQGMNDMGGTIEERLVTVNPKYYRPADVEVLKGDSRPIRDELGWTPLINFKQLIERMVASDISKLYDKDEKDRRRGAAAVANQHNEEHGRVSHCGL